MLYFIKTYIDYEVDKMYKALFMEYPGNLYKAFSLSYDDGFVDDIRLCELMKRYNIKGTFNLNSNHILNGNEKRLNEEQCKNLYSNPLFEVAVHGKYHSFLAHLATGTSAMEILEDRRELERIFEKPIFGMVSPYNDVTDELIEAMKVCNIKYCRGAKASFGFEIPENKYRLTPTCHHNYPELMKFADEFLELQTKKDPNFFYVWGHSYEFDKNNNWDIMENFLEKMSGKDDIWYCTNIEFVEYCDAYKRLEMDVDMKYIFNPTAYDLYFRVGYPYDKAKHYVVHPGETLKLG